MSQGSFGANTVERGTLIAMLSSVGTSYKHDDDKWFSDAPLIFSNAGSEAYSRCRPGLVNVEDNDVLRDESQLSLNSTKVDSDGSFVQVAVSTRKDATTADHVQCWLHNCGGRSFTSLSNYRRHCREKSRVQAGVSCSLCGRHFTRKSAWKIHTDKRRCRFIDHDFNGIPFGRKNCLLDKNL